MACPIRANANGPRSRRSYCLWLSDAVNDLNHIKGLGESSRRTLRWFLGICASSGTDSQQLVRAPPHSFEHLSDPSRFIVRSPRRTTSNLGQAAGSRRCSHAGRGVMIRASRQILMSLIIRHAYVLGDSDRRAGRRNFPGKFRRSFRSTRQAPPLAGNRVGKNQTPASALS